MGRYALLVATGLYEDPQLSQLRAPAQDVSRLAAVLEDPAVGGFDEVRVLSDSTDYEIRVALTDLLSDRDRDDMVLVYFSCHGVTTLNNRLFFAATNTVHKRPAGTAVARSFVNEQMEDCHAASRILLLDCCFSGAYSEGMKSAPTSVVGGKAGEGYVVVTASDALEYSWESDTLSLESPRSSVFTDVLIAALTDPATDLNGDGWLTLDEVFRQVQEGVVARRPNQNPKLFAHAAEPNQIRIARARTPDTAASPKGPALATRPKAKAAYNQRHFLVARGVVEAAAPIARTIGPLGRYAVIQDQDGRYQEASDALTIAELFRPDDPRDELGARYICQLVRDVHNEMGDGSATAVILAQAMILRALDRLRESGNPVRLRRGLELAFDHVQQALASMAWNIETKEQISAITGFAALDPVIGDLIAEALDKIGKDGAVDVEESNTQGYELQLFGGIRFDRGYVSHNFMTDEDRREAILEDPYILITDQAVTQVADLLPLLEKVMESGKPLLVIAAEIDGEALATLVANKIRDTFKSAAVMAPGQGGARKAMLMDLAILTGGHVVSPELGVTLPITDLALLGRARKIIVRKDETVIVDAGGDPELIQRRVLEIRTMIDRADSDRDRQISQLRLDRLAGGVAVIKVGAPTEAELRERTARVRRALRVVAPAIEEGVVPGGGTALLELRRRLPAPTGHPDEAAGYAILVDSLHEPALQIIRNAGFDEDEMTADSLFSIPWGKVFDAKQGREVDALAEELVDSAAVVKAAVARAVSLVQRFLLIG